MPSMRAFSSNEKGESSKNLSGNTGRTGYEELLATGLWDWLYNKNVDVKSKEMSVCVFVRDCVCVS